MQTTTMTELDAHRAAFAQEGALTKRVLRAFPENKIDDRPCSSAQSAREIAWTTVVTMMVVDPILAGELTLGGLPEAPKSWKEILDTFDRTLEATEAKVAQLADGEMNGMVKMPIGPNKIGTLRRGDALRMALHDQIHHRGQLSVLLRMAGGKVPSIYGPSGDEPWF
jgi:uncharacterized damage-inducible protein DinB